MLSGAFVTLQSCSLPLPITYLQVEQMLTLVGLVILLEDVSGSFDASIKRPTNFEP